MAAEKVAARPGGTEIGLDPGRAQSRHPSFDIACGDLQNGGRIRPAAPIDGWRFSQSDATASLLARESLLGMLAQLASGRGQFGFFSIKSAISANLPPAPGWA